MDALRDVNEPDKKQITPLIELCQADFNPKQMNTREEHQKIPKEEEVVRKKVETLAKSWCNDPIMIDLWHVNDTLKIPNEPHLFDRIGALAISAGLQLIPVTGLSRGNQEVGYFNRTLDCHYAARRIARLFGHGGAIRLLQNDLSSPTLQSDLSKIIAFLDLPLAQLDLIMDFQLVQGPQPSLPRMLASLPFAEGWRNVVVASGAFPLDLTHLPANDTYRLNRWEWLMWKEATSISHPFKSNPLFSDYTIQHPIYREPAPFAPSASIRYTSADYWLVIRGEKIGKGGPGSSQYPAEAELLCDKPEYCGAEFSRGDSYIRAKSKDKRNPGSPRTWLCAGINHHITFVLRQLESLVEPSVVG